MSEESYDLRLNTSSTMLIAGPSLSGKSFFTRRLLENENILFEQPFEHRFWFSAYPVSKEARLPNVNYRVGLPESFDDIPSHSLVVFDDLMGESSNNKNLTALITRGVHHQSLCVIMLTQNIFQDSKQVRTRNLNTHYLALFRNPRNQQPIVNIERQMFPRDKGFLVAAYEDACSQPYGYLFIDLHQTTPDIIRVRSRLLPNEAPMKAYIPKRLTHRL